MADQPSAVVSAPGEGHTIPRPDTGGAVTIKVSSDQTGGAISVWESHRSAGDTRGPGVHSHPGFDEMFYVLAGEYEFTAGGETFEATAGTLLFIPRGMFHAFSSTGDTEGRLLAVATPGGVEDFFEEMAVERDSSRTDEVGRKHGVIFQPAKS